MPTSTRGLADLRHEVTLLPGGVLPAKLAYGALLGALGDASKPVAKDLEVYAGSELPVGYTFGTEVQGILRTAEATRTAASVDGETPGRRQGGRGRFRRR